MAKMTRGETFSFADADDTPPKPEPTKQQPVEEAEVLLGWLNKWPKPVLTLKDARNFAPRAVRKKEIALNAAKVLAAHGHLTPLAAHKWQIVRQPLTPTSSQ